MQTFCQYTLIKELGRGGMGTVYLAKTAKGESVALKVMGPHLLRDEASRSRFKREPTLAPVHPNIVRMLEASECNGSLFFAMEWIDGESLDAILRRQRTLPPTQLVGLLRGVADALDHVHDRNIIHRDIKPSNILVRKDGHVYLTDFGVAKNTLGATATFMSVTGARIGTAHYMSPEQAMGKRDLTAASDIYALGVMAFHALSGRVPFDADSDVVVARMHMQDTPPDLRKVNPQVPPAVAEVVMRALKKDATKRYATAGAFVSALEQALNKPTIQPWIQRPLFWGALAVFVALVSVGLVWVLGNKNDPPRPIASALTPKAKTSSTSSTSSTISSSATATQPTSAPVATHPPLPAATIAPVVARPAAGATSTLAPTSTPEPTATRARPTLTPPKLTGIPTAAATVYSAATTASTAQSAQPANPPSNTQAPPQQPPQPQPAPTAAPPAAPTPAP